MALQAITNLWSVTQSKAGATAASASKAAGGAGVQHVAARVYASIASGATVQPAIQLNLIDGATGGTAICSWQMATGLVTALSGVNAVLVDTGPIQQFGLGFVGTANTAMTLEFAAAPVANTQNSVTLVGYDIP